MRQHLQFLRPSITLSFILILFVLAGCGAQTTKLNTTPLTELEGGIFTDRGLMVTLKNEVLFKLDSARILPAGRKEIEKIAFYLTEHPNELVLIEGHTDDLGAADYNAVLSKRRAEAVRKALEFSGTEEGRITTIGYGESRPIVDNDSPENRARNRRVEITIMAAEE